MTSTGDIPGNTDQAGKLIAQAAKGGAGLIMTPEVTGLIASDRDTLHQTIVDQADDPVIATLSDLARIHQIWLLIGSTPVRGDGSRAANRSVLVGPDGGIRATYDKIHMFDVDVGAGDRYRESANYQPGEIAILTDLPWGRLGMTICYDMRFSPLYLDLARAGAEFLSIPSAFTVPTGKAHWHVLLRARAIETGCFVFAPAQTGQHNEKRRTYGHSLIIDPWGEVLADGGTDVGIIYADIDPAKVAEARGRIPSLANVREYRLNSLTDC